MSFITPLSVQVPPLKFFFLIFFLKLDYSKINDSIFMKKLEGKDIGAFNNFIYLFSKVMYSLRDIGKIIVLSWVTPLSPTCKFQNCFFVYFCRNSNFNAILI